MWVNRCLYDPETGRPYRFQVNTATDRRQLLQAADDYDGWEDTGRQTAAGLADCIDDIHVTLIDLTDNDDRVDLTPVALGIAYVRGLIRFVGGMDVTIYIGGIGDGLNGALAAARPVELYSWDKTTRAGEIFLDPADIPRLTPATVIHELLHVLGFGAFPGSVFESYVVDGRFVGPHALAVWEGMSGDPRGPLLSERDSYGHWSEAVFGGELMTPYIEDGEPLLLSRLTAAVLQDLGYELQAEPTSTLGYAARSELCRYCI